MIQEITYGGWKRNLRLSGRTTELVITLDVGPRVIRYAYPEGPNVFAELPEQIGGSGEKEWMIRGGHRLWTAPEAEHSYDPDNEPVTYKKLGEKSVEITQPASKTFGFQKTVVIEILDNDVVKLVHRLTNVSGQTLNLTPWVLSVMAPGGMALIPQPELDLHPTEFPEGRLTQMEDFQANREMVLWPFTNLTDGRYVFSKHFLRVTHHPEKPATKIGLKLPSGWVAYQNRDYVFAKHFTSDPALTYPDRDSNFELFTNPAILELESLAADQPLAPGAFREQVEHWVLHKTGADLRGEKAACDFFAALPAL